MINYELTSKIENFLDLLDKDMETKKQCKRDRQLTLVLASHFSNTVAS